MVGINPFAKKQPSLLEFIEEVLDIPVQEYQKSLIRRLDTRRIEAMCGGRFKPNSIKQRTRLNRDMRNRKRRYAKYSMLMRRKFNYANQ